MHRVRLSQHARLDDARRELASSPGGLSTDDPAYLDYWSKEEILHFLEDLLECERMGAKAFASIGRAADLHVADLVFESELAQGAICVLLKKEIAARGGADTPPQKNNIAPMPSSNCNLERTIMLARGNQVKLAGMIEEAVLNIFDSKLNAKLMYLLLVHRKQVEQLEIFLT